MTIGQALKRSYGTPGFQEKAQRALALGATYRDIAAAVGTTVSQIHKYAGPKPRPVILDMPSTLVEDRAYLEPGES